MLDHLRLLAVFAHPDDESRIIGGTLAKYAGEDVKVYLCVATKGEATTILGNPPVCTPEELPYVRKRELEEACHILGIHELRLWDYPDGGLQAIDRNQIVGDIVQAIREIQPQVMVTFGPEGRTLHPDHVAVHRYATEAFHAAGRRSRFSGQLFGGLQPWKPLKLYYTTVPRSLIEEIGSTIPGQPDEEITICLDVSPYLEKKRRAAMEGHRSQYADPPFSQLDETARWRALSKEYFYLAYSYLPVRRSREDDLFEDIPGPEEVEQNSGSSSS